MDLQRFLAIVTIVLILLVTPLQADVITLVGGVRIEGEVTAQNSDEITVRRQFKDSGIYYTQTISRDRVLRIEPGKLPAASQPSRVSESQPGDARTQLSPTEQKELLGSAITRYRKQDHAGAGLELYRLINNTPAAELSGLSRACEEDAHLSLADLAAECHLQAALARARIVRLNSVTTYEKPALIPRLIAAYEDALREPAPLIPEPAAKRTRRKSSRVIESQPAEQQPEIIGDEPPVPTSAPAGPTVAEWLDKPQQFNGSRGYALALARQTRRALSLLTERVRLDPEVRTNRTLREELNKQRAQLMKLEKAAIARSEGAASADEKAARLERQQRVREQMQRDEEYRAQWEKERLNQALGLPPEGQPSDMQPPPDGSRPPEPPPPK